MKNNKVDAPGGPDRFHEFLELKYSMTPEEFYKSDEKRKYDIFLNFYKSESFAVYKYDKKGFGKYDF